MKVSDFQQWLRANAQWLAGVGGKQVATEIERLGAALEPYQDKTLLQFSDWLLENDPARQPEEGPAEGAKSRSRPSDPARIEVALLKISALYTNAIDPSVTYETIEASIAEVEDQLNKEEGIELAQRFELNGNFKSKKAALDAVCRKIKDRKSTHARAVLKETGRLCQEQGAWIEAGILQGRIITA